MSFGPDALRWMDGAAEALTDRLSRFRTPGTGEPVTPSVVGPIYRTARDTGSLDDLERVLRLYRTSSVARRTGSSLPQALYFGEQVQHLLADVRTGTANGLWTRSNEVAAMASVLGMTMRALRGQRGRSN